MTNSVSQEAERMVELATSVLRRGSRDDPFQAELGSHPATAHWAWVPLPSTRSHSAY
jgi:hypothetical protein